MKQKNPTGTPAKCFALEALFTPEWSAVYNPLTRDRWNTSVLLDQRLVEALCAESPSEQQENVLTAAEFLGPQQYSTLDAQKWTSAGWTDALRHYLHTNMLPKLNYGTANGWMEDFRTMREKVELDPPPALAKRYSEASFRLPMVADHIALSLNDAVLLDPRVTPKRQTQLNDLATLLVEVFGVSGHKTLAVTGSHLRKTSPSGGSRHPTEAYVVAFAIEGLEQGVYHFDAVGHELELLRTGDVLDQYINDVFGLNRRIAFTPKAAIILSSIVERSMHRYRDSRSYRVLHFDVGHLLLSSQLVARGLGIPYFSAYSIADDAAEKLLGIDGLMETAMTQIVLG